ncbi:phage holin family protein [Chitinimonas sp. PSY-7]|uniref:phage holin family protein n=1 Tax=Chitinimonas sp. PSY-7 TaxID=3459088 RepID=UPI00403FE8E7
MMALYVCLCGFIALRLLAFRRVEGQHRPRVAWMAYLLVVATGSVPLRHLLGQSVPLDVSSLVMALLLAVAVCAARGNLADLFRAPKLRREHPITRFIRRNDHV